MTNFSWRIASCLVVVAGTGISSGAQGQYKGLGKESLTPAQLKTFAPPPLPKDLSNQIQKMLEVTTPGLGILAPNGQDLYFTWKISGTNQLWRLNKTKGFPVQLTSGKDPTYIADISPDGQALALSRDHEGEENPGIYFFETATGRLETFFHKPKVQTAFLGYAADGKSFLYRANDKSPESFAIYSYDLNTKTTTTVVAEKGTWSVSDRKGSLLLLRKAVSSRASEIFLYDLVTKKMTPLLGQNESHDYSVGFGAKAGEYLVLTDKLDNFRRLYSWQEGQFKRISPEVKWDVGSFMIDEPRTKILWTLKEGGYTKLFGIDASSTVGKREVKSLKLPEFPGAKHVVAGTWTRDGRYTTLRVVTAKNPGASYVLDWKTGKLSQWVLPSAPEVDLNTFAEESLEEYRARDGTAIPMFVRRPPQCATTACPVIVSFHGGPESQSMAGFSPVAQIYVNAGFIVVEPNVRGSSGYGKEWLDSDTGPLREKVITDIEDCALHLRKNWQVTKLGVTGGSYGGYSTFMAMTKFAGAYDAGVAIVGMSDLRSFLLNTAPYRRHLRTSEYGDPEKDKESLQRLSPITYLSQVKSPLLIIQGVNDPRVPVGEALQIQQKLGKKKLSELILMADEGHGSKDRDNRVIEIGHTLQFFTKNLLDKGTP